MFKMKNSNNARSYCKNAIGLIKVNEKKNCTKKYKNYEICHCNLNGVLGSIETCLINVSFT